MMSELKMISYGKSNIIINMFKTISIRHVNASISLTDEDEGEKFLQDINT